MARVEFNYATMGAGKTALACIKAYNYDQQGLSTMCLSPLTDLTIVDPCWDSRIEGLKRPTTTLHISDDIQCMWFAKICEGEEVDAIIIDEVQFISVEQVEQLFRLAIYEDVQVICYGILTDFTTTMWDASRRLIELGATLNCITQVGHDRSETVINAKVDSEGNIITDDSEQVSVEKEQYKAITLKQYWDSIK